ncbi:glyoxalase [Actibacterium mucosum KCTC 23349]|uniref:Glyoxalase n=1 Tax=Actibacterium mucosum KCTC 23349 TaxID=1454373 RepID=A0A037ZF35_9RHOB|nr:VOC family protein [Actibacterium mucosum]KAJ54146.1 glyoxalase [Actibacterium mucosum KCTC 23349]
MPFTPPSALVWSEIPATDLDAAIAFYKAVFDWDIELQTDGPNPFGIIKTSDPMGAAGHIYPGKPAAEGQGPTPHYLVPDSIEASVERLVAAGGTKLSDPIPFPGGRFLYAQDPDGNSIGLFQPPSA